MHVLLIKYVQLICISVFLKTVNCEELLIENERDEIELNVVAACTSKCLRDIEQVSLIICMTENIITQFLRVYRYITKIYQFVFEKA